jgi:predicted RNase H-like HicB family nuclease
MRNAEEYTISVRRESFDGESMYVARVEELPDVEEYADSADFARILAMETIRVTQKIFAKKGLQFPDPKKFSNETATGRITLRLMPMIHAQAIKWAEKENVSLNFFVSTCVTAYISNSVTHSVEEKMDRILGSIRQIQADTALNRSLFAQFSSDRHVSFFKSSIKTIDFGMENENVDGYDRGVSLRNLFVSPVTRARAL